MKKYVSPKLITEALPKISVMIESDIELDMGEVTEE